MKRVFCVFLALLTLGFAACGKKEAAPAVADDGHTETTPSSDVSLPAYHFDGNAALLTRGEDYITLFDVFGDGVSLTDVKEDENGLAYIVRDGTIYLLGLDFLARAMMRAVGGEGEARHAEYAAWYKYYVARRAAVAPEIPLCSFLSCTLYDAAIKGVSERPVGPYRDLANALLSWRGPTEITVGSTAELTGRFRRLTGQSTDADRDVYALTTGLQTVITDETGAYVWNDAAVAAHRETLNADGSKTFTVEIKAGLCYSNGLPVKAADYLAAALVFSTSVARAALGYDQKAALRVAGYDTFAAYTGREAPGATRALSGIRLLDENTFSVTIDAAYLPYIADLSCVAFAPTPSALWLGDCTVRDDGEGAYLSPDFYAVTDGVYNMAAHIAASLENTDDTVPCAGPYVLTAYEDGAATLTANPYFAGDREGLTPAVETVVYRRVTAPVRLSDLAAADVFVDLTYRAADTAIALAKESDGAYAAVTSVRVGCACLSFRCDFGPTRFAAVRAAIACCLDSAALIADIPGACAAESAFTGILPDASEPARSVSLAAAVALLEADGWVYNAEGGPFAEGVRYKRVAAGEASEADKTFASADGAYAAVRYGNSCYIPLALNWYGIDGHLVSDRLRAVLEDNDLLTAAGFAVSTVAGDRSDMQAERERNAADGAPCYNAFIDTLDPRDVATGPVHALDTARLTDPADVYLLPAE